MAGLVIKPRARILHGHDWVFSGEVLKSFGNPEDGDIISLKDGRDHLIGSAIYNSKSQIVARRFSRRRQDLDLDFFQRRIAQAVEYRKRRGLDLRLCRLVWSESDGLPGVIVDRYGGDHVVLQTLTLAMDQRKALIVEALKTADELSGLQSIIERNDAPVRRAEGMELHAGVLMGEPPAELEIEFVRTGRRGGCDRRGSERGKHRERARQWRTERAQGRVDRAGCFPIPARGGKGGGGIRFDHS